MTTKGIRIAFILPSLAQKGPIIVVKDIISYLIDKVELIDVYYFDEIDEVILPCKIMKILSFNSIQFDKYNIIHSHLLRPDFYLWLYSKRVNAKMLTTVHNFIFDDIKNSHGKYWASIFLRIWPYFWKRMDKVVVLSNTMRNYYLNRVNPDKIQVIYNGRNSDFSLTGVQHFKQEDENLERIKAKYKIVGICAVLTERKGIDQLIAALVDQPDIYLVIIGEGPAKDKLLLQSVKLRVNERCLFLGFKPVVHYYFRFFDIYAMPSRSEGFPLALLEAGSYGLPIVCSDIPTFIELFEKDEVEFFKLENIDSLQSAINNAIKNKVSLSIKIKSRIYASYSVQRMAHSYLKLYEELTGI